MGDDFAYGGSFKENGKVLNSFNDLVDSMTAHWQSVNGRILVFSAVSSFAMVESKWLFNTLNTFFFLLLVIYGKKLIARSESTPILNYILLGIGYWFLLPTPAESMFSSIAYSVMYLWSSVVNLIFIYLFYNVIFKNKKYNIIFLIIISFIAGWSHEAIAVGVMAAIGIYSLIRIKYSTKHQWLMFAFYLIGFCLLFFSPGNFNRASGLLSGNLILNLTYGIFKFFIYAYAFDLFLIVAIVLFVKKKKFLFSFLRERMFFNIIIIVTILFNMATNFSGNGRVLFLSETLIIIYLIDLLNNYFKGKESIKSVILVGLSVIIAIQYFIEIPRCIRYKEKLEQIYSDYDNSKDGYVRNPSDFLSSIEEGKFIFLPASMRDCGSFIAPYGRLKYPNNVKQPLEILPKYLYDNLYKSPQNFLYFDYVTASNLTVYSTKDKYYYFYEVGNKMYEFKIEYSFKNNLLAKHVPTKIVHMLSNMIISKSFTKIITAQNGKKYYIFEQNMKMKWLIDLFSPKVSII